MKFFNFFGYIMIISCFAATFYIRFTNIDMTETRLFIEFWPLWLLIFVNLLGGGLLISDFKLKFIKKRRNK